MYHTGDLIVHTTHIVIHPGLYTPREYIVRTVRHRSCIIAGMKHRLHDTGQVIEMNTIEAEAGMIITTDIQITYVVTDNVICMQTANRLERDLMLSELAQILKIVLPVQRNNGLKEIITLYNVKETYHLTGNVLLNRVMKDKWNGAIRLNVSEQALETLNVNGCRWTNQVMSNRIVNECRADKTDHRSRA